METLETSRLFIRAFRLDDMPAIHRILDQAFDDGSLADDPQALQERRGWVQQQALNAEWFPKMHQAPYGDRAVVLKAGDELIGSVGFVPLVGPFDQIPGLGEVDRPEGFAIAEFGLFWVIDPAHQGRGYATEAARAMIDYAFRTLRLRHIIAGTEYDNLASQAVMRKLGMTLSRNPFPEPSWLQVIGILKHPELVG